MKTFTVPKMTSGHCVITIESSINAIDPTATIICDLARRSVSIASILNVHALIVAMREAGFEGETA